MEYKVEVERIFTDEELKSAGLQPSICPLEEESKLQCKTSHFCTFLIIDTLHVSVYACYFFYFVFKVILRINEPITDSFCFSHVKENPN